MNQNREQLMVQAIRSGIYALVVLLGVLQHVLQGSFYNWDLLKWFYAISTLGLLVHFVSLWNLPAFFAQKKIMAASFVLDIVLISVLMNTTALNQSLFLFMYLITIILSGLVFQTRGALWAASLASIGFSVVSILGPELKALNFFFLLLLNNLAFFVVAFLSGYLSDQLNLFASELKSQGLSLQVLRQLNQMIIENIPMGLMTVTARGDVLQMNPGAEALVGESEFGTQQFFDIFPAYPEWVEKLQRQETLPSQQVSYRREDEERLLGVQILRQSSEQMGDTTYLMVLEDLTEVQRLEFAVRQSEKMAAVGQLAAGIAHEIRNPLAGISGSIELLSQTSNNEDDKKLTKIILKEIDRLNNLITEFLDFAKPEKPPVDWVSLKTILHEVVNNAKLSSPVEVSVEEVFTENDQIRGHQDKLKQAFLNIVINAFQAMLNSPQKTLSLRTEFRDQQLIVRIKDSGQGMSAETKKRMFEPFHTTKPKGTGLGLAITHKILESHSAKIFVESAEGLGTEFIVSFPAKLN